MFKAFKKTKKISCTIFFQYIKKTNNYYQKYKERLWKEARSKYQKLYEAKKGEKRLENDIKIYGRRRIKKHQYYRERKKNLSEEQKQKLVGYMINYYLAHKKTV